MRCDGAKCDFKSSLESPGVTILFRVMQDRGWAEYPPDLLNIHYTTSDNLNVISPYSPLLQRRIENFFTPISIHVIHVIEKRGSLLEVIFSIY
jgi:hypothetical protein